MRRSIARCLGGLRSYCTDSGDGFQSTKLKIFDRHLKRKQRDRAAWLMKPKDSLVDTVAENILDRLEDCKKTFPTALCMGGSLEAIRRLLHGRGGIEKLLMMDTSWDMVKLCKDAEQQMPTDNIETSYVIGDEEYLPVKENSVDLVISCLGLHWTNDLPGAMIQSRLALKPDGLFLAAILGGESLRELRIACTIAQMEREGGISPRLSPLAQVSLNCYLREGSVGVYGMRKDFFIVKCGFQCVDGPVKFCSIAVCNVHCFSTYIKGSWPAEGLPASLAVTCQFLLFTLYSSSIPGEWGNFKETVIYRNHNEHWKHEHESLNFIKSIAILAIEDSAITSLLVIKL